MKKGVLIVSIIAVFIVTGVQSALPSPGFSFFKDTEMDIMGQTGFMIDLWQCSNDDQGRQFFIPIHGDMENGDFSFSLATAYVNTSYTPAEGESRSLNCIVDTKLNFAYEIIDRLAVDMLLGLDFNLPTGKTSLDPEELVLIMDSDLVSINTFGEGFNINPTISIIREWHKWSGSMGMGYVFRGEYDFSNMMPNYNPGDIYNITARVNFSHSSQVKAGMLAEYAFYSIDQTDGLDCFQEGNFLLLGLALDYTRTKWNVSFNLYSILRGKSKFLEGPELLTENRKSNGDEWVAGLSFHYILDRDMTVRSLVQVIQVNANDYLSDSPYFEGKRGKVSAGLGITRTNLYFPSLEGELFFRAFMLEVDKAEFLQEENLSYKGFSAEATLTHRF